MTVARQDPDTGRIYPNGKVGKLLEWLRWGASLALIPLVVWMFVHYAGHEQIEDFMDDGPRFVGTSELPNADTLRAAVLLDTIREISAHAGAGPHAGVDERLESQAAAIERIDRKLDLILERLPR